VGRISAIPMIRLPRAPHSVKREGRVLCLAQELPSFGLRVPVTKRGGEESTEVKARQKGDGWRTAKEFSARDEEGEGTTGLRASAYECERGDDVLGMKMYVHEEQMD